MTFRYATTFYKGNMDNLTEPHEVKTRKDTECEWCGEKIFKGELVIARNYIWDIDPIYAHQHKECFEAMQNYKGDLDEFYPGEFKRGTQEAK